MENIERLQPFFEVYNDDFFESIEEIRRYLNKYNSEYRNIKNNIRKLMDKNINIQKLLDEDTLDNGLTTNECRDLSKIILLYEDLQDILDTEIYFKGGMDAYYYFKRIGIIE